MSPFPISIKVLQQPEVELLLFTLQRKWNVLSSIASCHVSVMTLYKQQDHISESLGFLSGVDKT